MPLSLQNNPQRIAQRSSNFELYRIICMILIVAHHYVVNSGLWEILAQEADTLNVAGQYDASWGSVLLHSFGCVILVFTICSLIDYCRRCLFKLVLNGRN